MESMDAIDEARSGGGSDDSSRRRKRRQLVEHLPFSWLICYRMIRSEGIGA
ncbi:MAG: hypothetical protein WCF85_04490 [Rhodospirillaceae bacterium]